jgi:hypothetical protein
MIRDPDQFCQKAILLRFSASRKNAPIMMLAPVLTPRGLLVLRETVDVFGLQPEQHPRLAEAFLRGPGHGLLRLGADEIETSLPPVLSYWREFGSRYITALCAVSDIAERYTKPLVAVPADGELDHMAAAVPPMTGGEYLTANVLADLWRDMDAAFDAELADAGLSVQEFLKGRHPAWNLIGRVHFNLAENRKDDAAPFAFLVTYTTRLSTQAKAQHVPLGKALQEYAGAKNRERLLSLLLPIQRAAEHCAWLKAMVDAGEIFHPLRRRVGASTVPCVRRSRQRSGGGRHRRWGWTRCSTSGWK